MGVSVFTQSNCDICGEGKVVLGAHGEHPAKDWTVLKISTVGRGPGWSDSKDREFTLCPGCTKWLTDIFEAKKRRHSVSNDG